MAPRRLRLDAELVRRGLARSRDHATGLVTAGRVSVNKQLASKPAMQVSTDADLVVKSDDADKNYASRGGYKLQGALDRFLPLGLRVSGRRCLDAGASTGGFTDVLLRNGAAEVVAVDVGYGQMAWQLRQDERVQVHDRTNIREISTDLLGGTVDLVVGDLSFISLTMVLDSLIEVSAADGDLVLMVKPQFEVGREKLGKGGVVREPDLRVASVNKIVTEAMNRGWGTIAVCASPLPGPSGNIEYFLWLSPGDHQLPDGQVEAVVLASEQLLKASAIVGSDPTDERLC